MISVLAFFSENPSLNPADALSFYDKFVFEKNEIKQKVAGVGPFKKVLEENVWGAVNKEWLVQHRFWYLIRGSWGYSKGVTLEAEMGKNW